MIISSHNYDPIEIIISARKIANYANIDGNIFIENLPSRVIYGHMGAVLADSILQAGVNYKTVVLPRISRILNEYSEMKFSSDLSQLIELGKVSDFLQWKHYEKISRFEDLVKFMNEKHINDVNDLAKALHKDVFRNQLRSIRGIGPKTIDYMACLVGIESIAVDRHIVAFAKRAGIKNNEYDYLNTVFCYAADLLSISRRQFDSWIWNQESQYLGVQQILKL